MKIKTEWNLGLLYKGDDDPQIEKDIKEIERLCANLERKYKSKDFTKSSEILLGTLKDLDDFDEKTDGNKPWWYFALKTDLNSENKKASALSTKYGQRLTEADNKIKFFRLRIGQISKKQQKKFLKDPKLADYKYLLYKIFKKAEFDLTEREEQLVSLINQTSRTMWIDANQKILNSKTINHKGTEIPIPKAISLLSDSPKKDRRELNLKINSVLKSISHISEAEINAIYNFKKIMDKRRGYKKPYSATILGYENNEKSIELFVSLVAKYFKISHRFYKLHAKLLGEKQITVGDRNVKIGDIKAKFDFNTSAAMLRASLLKIDGEYASLLDKFLENGQIDVYPRKGKKGGAYCWGMGRLPTFLLLNHTNDVRSLETLAHEMGRAIHTELSKKQPPRYRKYSTASAEVASTFFEQIIADEIEKKLTNKEKVILLHTRIMGSVSLVFRQIACFNFELELHEQIREKGEISKEEMAELLVKHLKSYLGRSVKVVPEDGYFFVYWSHIRKFFYVYSYAYGQIISRALFEKWKEDKNYAAKVKQFLSAGKSMSPEDIFKSIGIDTSKPEFFEAGLKGIEKDITRLERLTSKNKFKK